MEWKEVVQYPGITVSENGDIKRDGILLNPFNRVRGYLGVRINRKSVFVHTLVLLAFHGDKPAYKYESMHLDNNRTNNNKNNLKWGTHAENMGMDHGNNHSYKNEKNPNSKLSTEQVKMIRDKYDNRTRSKWGRRELAKLFGVSERQVWRIAHRLDGGWE
ncbi:MAG: HNH endonuclease [Candidatus Nanoarchaeia archaeon]|nr:HNH endonuclease [Candidatus Nanoarchaeia archaeon]